MTHSVMATWITDNAEQKLVDMARVSNPGSEGQPAGKLIGYLIRNKHWSPFEMINLCVEINTTRDIGRQLLRHWTLRPQEFSQRYQDVTRLMGEPVLRECRMQHATNRQSSIVCNDPELIDWWIFTQNEVWNACTEAYTGALKRGIAKEVARVLMPEGLTPTRMHFNGNLRSWLHFCELRMGHGTQAEATSIAEQVWSLIETGFPNTAEAFRETWA